jgi:hypothetical protein
VIGHMAGLGQPLDQPGRRFAIVLDNQNAHGTKPKKAIGIRQ